jgi:hypothetical protein
VRRKCLDHILILSERQLYRLVGQYVVCFNHSRPHQGMGQRIPDPQAQEDDVSETEERTQCIVARPVLGGLHHDYRWVA